MNQTIQQGTPEAIAFLDRMIDQQQAAEGIQNSNSLDLSTLQGATEDCVVVFAEKVGWLLFNCQQLHYGPLNTSKSSLNKSLHSSRLLEANGINFWTALAATFV